ncbi:SRPBCC domain-containing protein [Actinomadura rubrisoli]|uniref:Polyketide cyclase n=1 Tax=Actinomadura rubrisoli TaxID=2530368 RepID=A0A4R5CCQ9_9ACTN|nr:SRPBCC domain-containing protein [Actinomadura rubrisoli]TDD96669.1 polyketide cyclase [Actinomadura rubrisoli]
MSENVVATPPVAHSTVSLARTYPVPPARVFAAFANEATKRRWSLELDGMHVDEFAMDFRVGGTETARFRVGNGPRVHTETVFQDIVPDTRVVFAYRMAMDGTPTSAALTTVQIAPAGDGAILTYTEQSAYFHQGHSAELAEEGCAVLLASLGDVLAAT